MRRSVKNGGHAGGRCPSFFVISSYNTLWLTMAKKEPINPPSNTKYASIESFFSPNRFAVLADQDQAEHRSDIDPPATPTSQDEVENDQDEAWTLVEHKRRRSQASTVDVPPAHRPAQRPRTQSPGYTMKNMTEDEEVQEALRVSALLAAKKEVDRDAEWPPLERHVAMDDKGKSKPKLATSAEETIHAPTTSPATPPPHAKRGTIDSFFHPNRFAVLADQDQAESDSVTDRAATPTSQEEDDKDQGEAWTLVENKRRRSQSSTIDVAPADRPPQRPRTQSPGYTMENMTEEEELEEALRASALLAAKKEAERDAEWPPLERRVVMHDKSDIKGKGKAIATFAESSTNAAAAIHPLDSKPSTSAVAAIHPLDCEASTSAAAAIHPLDNEASTSAAAAIHPLAIEDEMTEDTNEADEAVYMTASDDEFDEAAFELDDAEDESDLQPVPNSVGIPTIKSLKIVSIMVHKVTPQGSGRANHVAVWFFESKSKPASFVSGHVAGDGLHLKSSAYFGICATASSVLEMVTLLRIMRVPDAQLSFSSRNTVSRLGGGRLGAVLWKIHDVEVDAVWRSFGLASSSIYDVIWSKAVIFIGDVHQNEDRARFLVFVFGLILADGSVAPHRCSDQANCYFERLELAARDKKMLELVLVNWVAVGGIPSDIAKSSTVFRIRISASHPENIKLFKEGLAHIKEFCDDLPPRLAKLDHFLEQKKQPLTVLSPEYNQVDFTTFVTDHDDGELRVLAQDVYRMDTFAINPILKALDMAPISSIHELSLQKLLEGLKRVDQLCTDNPNSVNGMQRALSGYYKLLALRTVKLPLKNRRKIGFPCPKPDCDRKFLSNYDLEIHQRMEHGAEKLKCDYEFCNLEANTRGQITKHVQACHKKNKKSPYKCFHAQCECYFKHPHPTNHPAAYQEHVLKFHDVEIAFPCDHQDCEMVFSTEQDLATHARTHEGDAKVMCLYCDRLFKDGEARAQHMRSSHKEKFVKAKWQCPDGDCNVNYASKKIKIVEDHYDAVHRGKVYRCRHDGCCKRYANRSDLKTHRVVHTKGKSTCILCARQVFYIRQHYTDVHKLSLETAKKLMELLHPPLPQDDQ
ncbi:hypothetical protein BC940DRAFT_108017 [Gongronella butleri]|nr:hypothetical protein BC940DRAFT_108017 [Gongronella butleri]